MQHQAVSKVANCTRLEFPACNGHSRDPPFRWNGGFIDAQRGQLARSFEMFKSMGSDGRIIGPTTEIATEVALFSIVMYLLPKCVPCSTMGPQAASLSHQNILSILA